MNVVESMLDEMLHYMNKAKSNYEYDVIEKFWKDYSLHLSTIAYSGNLKASLIMNGMEIASINTVMACMNKIEYYETNDSIVTRLFISEGSSDVEDNKIYIYNDIFKLYELDTSTEESIFQGSLVCKFNDNYVKNLHYYYNELYKQCKGAIYPLVFSVHPAMFEEQV